MKGPALVRLPHPTVNAALESAAQTPSGLTFVDAREEDTFLPFAQLYLRAQRVAGSLRERGIRTGDRVAMVLPTSVAFMDAFFGALLAGAVPVPLYPPVRLGRLAEYHRATARMLTASGARIVLSDARVRLLLGESVAAARPALGLVSVSALEEEGSPYQEPVSGDQLGLVQFSSGSTVDPKPVALSHANLVSQCAVLRALLPPAADGHELGVSWLPLYHDMGLIGCLLPAVTFPGPLTLIPPELFLARPALWLRTLSRHRGTLSAAPNFAYALCLKRVKDAELEGVDLSRWRYALNGAEPISGEVMRRFAQRFAAQGFEPAALMPVYGLSEASLAVTFTPRRSPLREAKVDAATLAARAEVLPGSRSIPSVGVPVPGCEVEVRSEEGEALGEGRAGKIFARGPSVMTGYLDLPEATARALSDGWLDTGDLGFWEDGELHVSGRSKDLVIIRGANHAPQEFEECLEGLEGFRAGCAVALGFTPEDAQSEALLILAERAKDQASGEEDSALEERIRVAVTERTKIRPHTVKVIPPGTLPRTSSGKMRRAEALRQFLAQELAAPRRVGVLTLAAQMTRSSIALLRTKLDPED